MSDDALLQRIRLHGAIPTHVAIIMDGNGRWAQGRSLPRPLGHQAGMAAVREAVEGCLDARASRCSPCSPSARRTGSARPARSTALMSLLEEYIAEGDVRPARARASRSASWASSTGWRRRRAEAVERIVADDRGRRRARAQPLHLLRRPRRDHPRGAALAEDVAAGRLDPGADRRGGAGAPPLHAPSGPIPICSSAPRARCGSPTSCSGSSRTPSST